MIHAQAMAEHSEATGHTLFGPTETPGIADCKQCPWQYPPAEQNLDHPAVTAHQHGQPCELGPGCELDDPGPVPAEQPEVPPLDLRARIANAIDRWADERSESIWVGDVGQADLDQLAEMMHAEVGAGADWEPRIEATAMSPAQALAFLLDLPEWSRISRLRQLLDQAEVGANCYALDHPGKLAEIKALHISRSRYREALDRIGHLCVNVDGRETDLQNMIGTIAAEALVHRD